MLSLLRRPRSSVSTRQRPVRLQVERLETRSCPAAPVITSMSFTELPQKVVRISGTVTDDHTVSAVIITFTGVVNNSTTVNSSGQFVLQAQAAGLGQVSATAYDPNQNLTSAAYTLQITSTPPTITNFRGVQNTDGTWTFSGTVLDAAPQGEQVGLTGLGVNGAMATCNASGYFSITLTLASGQNGTVNAQTTDWWGQASSQAQFIVNT
jgi:hypothetical protein